MSQADPDRRRPILTSVSGDDTVRVVLEHRGRHYVGECDVTPECGLAAASASATLQALDALTLPDVELRLDWCGVLDPGTGMSPAVVVYATATVEGVASAQAGAALVHHDAQVAAVRAALDALNRRLEILGHWE
ncbi:MAG TPA: hypothetical protein VM287_15350 [Egibacteraceae bacterium]|nr:hypothetical protein [Egibacteraceae bacterium]